MKSCVFKSLLVVILILGFFVSHGFLFTKPAFCGDAPPTEDIPELPPETTPQPPHLNKPIDPNFDAAYLVDWTDVDCAEAYKLEEADNPQFSNPVSYTLNVSQLFVNKGTVGTYYYRVKAALPATQGITKGADFLQKIFAWLRQRFSANQAYAGTTCDTIAATGWSDTESIEIVEPTSFISGIVYAADTETPLANAVVTSPDFVGSTTSDIDGKFSFSFQSLFPESGKLTVTIDVSKGDFTSAQRTVEVVASRHSAVTSVYLTPLDPVVTTILPEGGTHVNSTGEIELVFPAGAVTEAADVNSTKYQKGKALPDELPETSFFTYALNLEAESTTTRRKVTTFQQPVTMKVANTLGFAPGTPIPGGVYNEETHQWEDTGLMGSVSSDGQWLEFEIDHFSPWDLNFPAPPPPKDKSPRLIANRTQDIDKQFEEARDPGVGVKSGSFTTEHDLAGIIRLGKKDSLKLIYNSLTAQPSSLICIETDLDPVATNIPDTTTFKVKIADRQIQATYQGVEGEVRYAYLLDAKDSQGQTLSTGSYPYIIEVSNDYTNVTYWTTDRFAGDPISDTGVPTIEPVPLSEEVKEKLIVNNQQNSPFGAGWSLQGLQRLHFDADGSILLTEGNGSSMVFNFQQSPILDLAVANTYDDNISILFGNGDGTFLAQPNVTVGNQPRVVATADFNIDTIPDLVVANYIDDDLSIFLGNDDGTFSVQPDVPVGVSPILMATADFNGDSLPDLAVGNVNDNHTSILLGNGDGTFLVQPDIFIGNSARGITTADFDRDNLFDIAEVTGDYLRTFLSNGDGTFSNIGTFSLYPYSIASADFNRDAIPDLAITRDLYSYNAVSILFGNGNGTFSTYPYPTLVGGGPWAIATADFNGDTLPDLAVVNANDNNVSILLNDSDGTTFSAQTDIIVGTNPGAIVTADFNGDTLPDLAVGSFADNNLSILLNNNGNGTFSIGEDVQVGTSPSSLIAANFNGDYLEKRDYVVSFGDYSFITQNLDGTYRRKLKDGTQINFNAHGLQTSIVDRNGNSTAYLYIDANSDGKEEELSKIVLPTGDTYQFIYSAEGKFKSITDPAGRIAQFIIDENNDLVQISNPDSTTKTFSYTNHLLTSETNERLFTTQYEYDSYGRVTRMLFPNTPQEIIQFFPSDVQGLINDLAPGVGTPDNPAPVVRPDDIVETIIDGKNYSTTSQTSKFGAYSQITDALNQTTIIARDVNDNPTKITRPNSSTVIMTYDWKGNLLTSTEDSISATTAFSYEPDFNQITSITDPENNTTNIDYDENGNPIQITDAQGNITKMEYNSRGLVTKIISGFGTAVENQTIFTYYTDTYNLKTTTDPEGNTTTFTYDSAGNILTIQDAENNTTTFEYDDINRLTKVTDPETNITQYQYDEAGNLKKIIDANLNETNFTYDEINQLKTITNPLGNTKTFSYDLNRNLETTADFNADTITFSYDDINRLSNKSGSGLNVTYDYDSVNNLTSVTTPDSSLSMIYDLASRIETSTTLDLGHQPGTIISYTYDKNSNRLTLTDPEYIVTKYVYDSLNRLIDITDALDQNLAHFNYDELSRRTGLNLANGTTSSYAYDLASRLVSLDSYSYTYDNAGNRLTMTDSDGTHNYTYDDIYRLTNASHPQPENPAENYAYDSVGNRNPTNYTYDDANRLLEDDEYTYSYDDNGNLTSKTNKSTLQITTYTYNLENQLIRINFPNLTSAQYTYDGLGRRIEKNVNGTITRYVYDNEDIIAEYDGINTLRAKYLHGPGIDEPLRVERGGGVYWYHVDGLGSITELTDSTGIVVPTYLYDSFGNIKAKTGSLINPYTYTGRELDLESGFYYYRARYYDAAIGRFLQEDPVSGIMISPQTLNLYPCVSNNPINFIDPFGFYRQRSWLDRFSYYYWQYNYPHYKFYIQGLTNAYYEFRDNMTKNFVYWQIVSQSPYLGAHATAKLAEAAVEESTVYTIKYSAHTVNYMGWNLIDYLRAVGKATFYPEIK
ncbi:MAG: FG-GAP-like repeat-containing protein [Candidatus Omnitrophota bacterium]